MLLEKGTSLEQIRHMNNGEERYQKYVNAMPIIAKYNDFMAAKNLGITFRPQDITYQDLKYFHVIKEATTIKEEKNGKRPH